MEPISREHEPSGFARVFVPVLGALAVAAIGWIVRQPRGNPDPWADAAPLLPEQEQAVADDRSGDPGQPPAQSPSAAPGAVDQTR